MLGDGPLQKEFTEKISNAGLDERIHLHGWVTPEQVIKIMDKSDILFMPSLSEGLPVVGVQALEAGLAIVASNVGGFVDLVDQGRNGTLHSPSDSAGMKQALTKLLSDKKALLSARLVSREIVEKFDIKPVTSKYENLMFEVLQDAS
jgi:glycosyltransferase involved in cell wall biosynthesis